MEILQRGGVIAKMWTDGVSVEDGARAQIASVARLPFVGPHIAVMPDVHVGKGCTVGSVIPTLRAIVPAAVGVDIGCGMTAAMTSLTSHDIPEDLRSLRHAIEEAVPHGRTDNGGSNDRGRWGQVPEAVSIAWMGLENGWKRILSKHPKLHGKSGVTAEHIGTLGTGNHFLELCLDEEDRVWVMLHSGSRGPGNRIGMHFIELAKRECEKWFVKPPDNNWDLAYLPEDTELFDDYVHAVSWAQDYAKVNRDLMMSAVLRVVKKHVKKFDLIDSVIDCHHNYVTRENHFGKNLWLTRKGAVSARKGQKGIIPGSMGTKSYIVSGKGNKESFNSCSHGAGRRMSRTEAQKTFTLEDHRNATVGVECRKDRDVIDETPGAYKDVDAVIAAQVDLIEVVHTLKQFLCVKG